MDWYNPGTWSEEKVNQVKLYSFLTLLGAGFLFELIAESTTLYRIILK